MPYHRFRIGQTVVPLMPDLPDVRYTILELLSLGQAEPHYRVRSHDNGQERVVFEREIKLPCLPRAPRIALAVCGLCGLTGWIFWVAVMHRELGQDWMVFYTAAHSYFDGTLASIYDGMQLTETINQRYGGTWLSMPLNFHPWLYPPHFLLLLLPFGALSFGAAYVLFVSITFAALCLAVAGLIQRAYLSVLALLIFPQTAFAFVTGQNCFLTTAIFVAGFRLLQSYPIVAGALLGIGSYKPQLFLLAPIALTAARQWKALASAAAMVAAMVMTSFAVFGTAVWHDWAKVMFARSIADQEWLNAGRIVGQSVFTCVTLLGTPPGIANALQMLAVLLGAGCVYWAFRRQAPLDMQLAVLLSATLLASPHVSSQDGVLLAVGSLLLFGRGLRDGFRRGDVTALIAVWLVELGDPPKFLGIGIVTPLMLCLFIAVVVFRTRAIETDSQPDIARTDPRGAEPE
jgi:hypothetical protein